MRASAPAVTALALLAIGCSTTNAPTYTDAGIKLNLQQTAAKMGKVQAN